MLKKIKSAICSDQQKKSLSKAIPIFQLNNCKSEIKVIYFTGYDSADEQLDLEFTIKSLTDYGINKDNIFVFAPVTMKPLFADVTNFFEPHQYVEKTILIQTKYLLAYVGGHGAHNGVGYSIEENNMSTTKIFKPNEIISPLDKVSGLELCVLFITQCYSGVFNYWDTYSKKYSLCIIGSTGMHSAIASAVDQNEVSCNIFLYYLNKWLMSTNKDLDGDGVISLLDMFKYSGFYTGKFFINFRRRMFQEVNQIIAKIENYDKVTEAHLIPMKEKELKESLEFLHTNQEPWILNANQARNVHF